MLVALLKNLVNNYSRKFDIIKLICEQHKNDKTIIFNEYNTYSYKNKEIYTDILKA